MSTESDSARLETLVQQEELALGELERLVSGLGWVAVSAEPQAILDELQRIEEVLGKLGHLATMCNKVAAELLHADEARPLHSSCRGNVRAGGMASAIPAATRYRLLGVIARIAAHNEANRYFLAAMSRITGGVVQILSKAQQPGDSSSALVMSNTGTRRRPMGLDMQA